MAAAIIPIITSLLPIAAQAIPMFVKMFEELFGPHTGAEKLPAVLDATKAVLVQAAPKMPGAPMPDDATLRGMIEQEVQRMKAGLTAETPPVVVADGAPFEVVQGWIIREKPKTTVVTG